ncbi:type II secretion system F family protein [Pseudomonas sp. RIT-PI-AD]|uniref:type II secretion system F family protein n=1 Tax=Pseudomonas sp. RIT-PI-AD TaxID=3035294 RepID=UPI0021D9BDF6|nr:type II secretion system F family protein [Pseudomonas sp. RIT-PI-AD]
MPHFKYRAIDRAGKLSDGVVEQPSIERVADHLAREGLTAVSIQPLGKSAAKASAGASRAPAGGKVRRRRINDRDRVLHFTREMAVMLTSGLPLDRSLSILEELADDHGRAMINSIRTSVRKGRTLADSFAERPEFTPFYINMIKAGEASGSLEASMQRMAEYLERSKALRQMIVSALTYPTILFSVAILSLVFLLAYVVPSFSDLFSDMGAQLPAPTRFVMGLGDFMAKWWWLVLAMMGGIYWMIGRLWRDEAVRVKLDRRALQWPLIGELVKNVETTRFSRTLGVLLQGGVSLVNALTIARETVSNRTLRSELDVAGAALREGRSLSAVLLEGNRFPNLALHMIQVGEETGRLEEMLLKVATIYEDEVGSVTKRLLALLEPVLILSLGVLIAAIIMSILLGILGVNELVG